jgi:hypothetical protein
VDHNFSYCAVYILLHKVLVRSLKQILEGETAHRSQKTCEGNLGPGGSYEVEKGDLSYPE